MPNVQLIEIGGQPKVTVDVLYNESHKTYQPESDSDKKKVRLLYEMEKLQDPQKRRYATYEVSVEALTNFERVVGVQKIEYVHE